MMSNSVKNERQLTPRQVLDMSLRVKEECEGFTKSRQRHSHSSHIDRQTESGTSSALSAPWHTSVELAWNQMSFITLSAWHEERKVNESTVARSFADIPYPHYSNRGFRLSSAKEPSMPTFSSACQVPRLEKHKKTAFAED